MATRTAEDTHYWLDNGTVKFRIGTGLIIDQIRIASLTDRNVMYFYPYITYHDGLVPATSTTFYFNTLTWTLTPTGPASAATVTVTATASTVSGDGRSHSFTATITLTDGDNFGKIVLEDVTDGILHNPTIALEANAFPQGYDFQNAGGNVTMGGFEDASAPLPYDDVTYVMTSVGTLTPATSGIADFQDVDGYLACYSTDASCGFFCRYVDFKQHRFVSYAGAPGAELQYIWFLFCLRAISTTEYETEFYFGGWEIASGSSDIASDWATLPKVETPVAPGSTQKHRIVRADINSSLYSANKTFTDFLALCLSHTVASPATATVIPAGSPDWVYFKWRNHPEVWNFTTADSGEDYVQKCIELARDAGLEMFVEIDILDNLHNNDYPADAALLADETTPNYAACSEDHSHQYPYPQGGAEIGQPREAIQANLSAGSDVVIQLPAGLSKYELFIGALVQITDDDHTEECEISAFDTVANTITVPTLLNGYTTAAGAYAVLKWFVTFNLGATWKACESCVGTGVVHYWVKMPLVVEAGETFHDKFIDYVTYLCENYSFYGLVLSESAWRHVDYSAEAKAQYIADTGEADWPRDGLGAIDTEDETLGKWKTTYLCQFYAELQAIANANSKKFFLMTQPAFWYPERMAWEWGQYYPTVLDNTDGLWVWMYYGVYDVDPGLCVDVAAEIDAIRAAHPGKEYFFSIGLWSPEPDVYVGITADELLEGLNIWQRLEKTWSIEVTPSKMMSDDHWDVLWGEAFVPPVGREMLKTLIPTDRFWLADYPNLDPEAEGLVIPERYGVLTNIKPICINTLTGEWKLGNRPHKALDAVREAGVTLDPASEYTVNADKNEFTIGMTPLLEAGKSYIFVLESDITINGTDWLGFAQQTNPAYYPGGTLYYINGANQWTDQDKDVYFILFVKDALDQAEYDLTSVSNYTWHPGWNYEAELRKTAASTKIAQSFTMPATGGPWYLSRIQVEAVSSGTGTPDPARTTRMTIYSVADPPPALPADPTDAQVGSKSYRMENYTGMCDHACFPQRGAVSDLKADIQGIMNDDGSLMKEIADVLQDVYVEIIGGSSDGLKAADLAALAIARTEDLAVNLDTDTAFQDFMRKAERGQLFKLVPQLDGTFGLKFAASGEPAGTPHYQDPHFLSFTMERNFGGIYAKAKVYYDQDAGSQEWKVAEAESDIARIFYRTDRTLEVETFLKDAADALQLAEDYLGIDPASGRKQHLQKSKISAKFTLQAGLGWDLVPAQKVKITRARAMSATGALAGILFVVTKVTKHPGSGLVDVEAALDTQTY